VPSTRSVRLLTSSLTRFLWDFGPKTPENGDASTIIFALCCLIPLTPWASRMRDMGSLLDRRRTVCGSFALSAMASRKAVSEDCEITRVLVNHFRFGSILALGTSLDWSTETTSVGQFLVREGRSHTRQLSLSCPRHSFGASLPLTGSGS